MGHNRPAADSTKKSYNSRRMERFKKALKRLSLPLLALACLAVSWISVRVVVPNLELKTVDYRFRLLGRQPTASPDIVLVDIDELSIQTLEPQVGRWPWSRDVHAELLRFLRRARAKIVIFDVLFTEGDIDHPERDRELAGDTAKSGNVIHAVALVNQKLEEPDRGLLAKHSIPAVGRFEKFEQAELPIKPIAQNARGLGHVAMTLDADGPWRRNLLLAGCRDRLVPSLGLAACLALQNLDVRSIGIEDQHLIAGSVRAPLDENGQMTIWFNGGPYVTYRLYSYKDVFLSQLQLENHERPFLDPRKFENKIVIVGATAQGLHDTFASPYSGTARDEKLLESGKKIGLGNMSGMEVHANVIDDLLHNRYLRSLPNWLTWTIVVAGATAVLALIYFTPLWVAVAAALLMMAAYLPLAQFAFSHHWQLPVVPVILGWTLSVVCGFGYQYWIEGAERRKVAQIFSRYVSPSVYRHLLDDPSAVELGGKRQVITVLFSDIRGFTHIAEKLQPEEMIAQLNEYFSAMVEIVFQHEGTIDKFVGDMIMALFNTPMPDPDHPDHAVQCAIAMHRKLETMNVLWESQGRPQFHCGVGINTGEMVAGNLGTEKIQGFTVIGDNVNLGSRLESKCKDYQADIIISEFTRAALKHSYPMQELGDVVVKGKSKPVKIFQIFHSPATTSGAVPSRESAAS